MEKNMTLSHCWTKPINYQVKLDENNDRKEDIRQKIAPIVLAVR
jgi:hypothetical protein